MDTNSPVLCPKIDIIPIHKLKATLHKLALFSGFEICKLIMLNTELNINGQF
jgi:hypothetical protein